MTFNNRHTNNYNNNNNNNEDDIDISSDEDEENLIYKEYPSPLKTKKTSTLSNHNNNYWKKVIISSILNFKNNKLLLKKIITISILIILILIFLFYSKINYNNSNNNNNINFNNNNNKVNKILKTTNSSNNNYDNYLNNYCNEFLNGSLKKQREEEIGNNDEDFNEKCTFDINLPDYSCTPTSKKRSINFNYEIDDELNCNSKPIISVIIPFLNTESRIFNECISSILVRQSFKQIEVLLIDDGSTDEESIENYKKWKIQEGNRFKVIVNPINLGLPHSRNIGIYNSIGDYIFFFDSDDILEPTALEKLLWKLTTNQHIQFTKGYLVGFGKNINNQYIWKKGFEEREQFLNENQITISILYRRSMFGNKLENCDQSIDQDDGILKYPKELLEFQYDSNIRDGMEDWDFHLKCANNGYWGETLPEILEWYRRKDKTTMEMNWKNTIPIKRQSFLNQLKLKYSKLYDTSGGGGGSNFPNPIKNEQQFSYNLNNTLNNSKDIKNPLKKNKPRIVLILPWLNTGGADKFNLNLCKQLVEKGWEITILTTIQSDNKWLSRFQLYTPDIFLFNDGFLDYSSYPSFLCYLISSRLIDVIFISNSEFGYYLLPFIKSNKCYGGGSDDVGPLIVDYNHMEEEQWRNGGHPRQSIGMSKYLDIQFVSSNHLKNWMIKNGANQNKLSVLYINVDTDEFKRNELDRHSIRLQYNIDDVDHATNKQLVSSSYSSSSIQQQQTIVILYAARLTDQKKPIETLEIIKQLKNEIEIENESKNSNLSFKVLFVGDGYLRNKVDSYINKFGLSDIVKILGDVPTQDMKSIISASDIVLLPSSFEGISMIFYESMSIGLVPIGSNIGGQSELVSPDCGFLINNITTLSNSEFISNFIKPLKQLILNPKLIKKMGLKCKKRIDSNFKLDKMGNNLISNFCNLKQQQQQQSSSSQSSLEIDNNLFNNEFLIQTIEFLKLTKKFEKSLNDFNQLYSLQSEILNLKKEIKRLENKIK